MSTPEIIFAALAACAPIVSVVIAWLAFRRNSKNDEREAAEEYGSMKADLAYIKAGIDDLKASDKEKDRRLDTLSEHVAKLEGTLDAHLKDKNAHNYANNKKPGFGGGFNSPQLIPCSKGPSVRTGKKGGSK